jgi:hypothetical protein
VDINTGKDVIATIKTVKINLSLLANQRDLESKNFTRTSMSATSRLNY